MIQGLSEADLRALATLLEDFGVSLGVAGDDRRVQPLAAGTAANSGAPRLASIVLADGRRLVVSGREHRVPAGTPPNPLKPLKPPNPPSLPNSPNSPTSPSPATPPTPSAPPPRPAAPSPFVAERRAGTDTADMRFRLLAEHSIDLIVAVDADLAIRYASPATAALLGCAPNDLHGHTLAELLAPEDRAAFIARHFTKAAQRGQVPDLFRALRRDGSTLWVEARVASLPPGNGLGDYLVTFRDADQRRRAEETLSRMNAELSTLASTDALTGLPNRRQFDATLHKEWYRALRDATPLGLLMIDVDRFKPLNDRFGHPTGDRFLACVGQVIRDNVRRAGDMAARYGGEEFAVVLPGTGADGALEIAEVIRRAVAAADTRGIVEGGYPLSVSIGVAATVALAGGGSASLVHSADSALYQAKRNGRNRVEILQ